MTRLSIRMFRTAPTGIDRVEYAYAREWLRSDGAIGVVTTPFFTGALPDARALDLLQRVERAWMQGESEGPDPVFRDVKIWLESPLERGATRARRFKKGRRWVAGLTHIDLSVLPDLAGASMRLDRQIARRKEPMVYFHCSHALLNDERRFTWLGRRGTPAVFFLHDAIPIEFPEFCSPGADIRHRGRLATVARRGSLAIANSEESRRAIRAALEEAGEPSLEIEVVPLGVDEAFISRKPTAPLACERPYFVCVGTIEPRKNLAFLLAVWRRLIERLGGATPRLLIIGRRGWENENVVDLLERSRALGPYVAEVSDLTDAGLAALIANAQALLAPSTAEGFGLPVAEGLALGVSVLASDIPAHHEVGASYAIYADPVEGSDWIAAIEALMDNSSALATKTRDRLSHYRPLSWPDHVARTRAILEEVVARDQARGRPQVGSNLGPTT